MRDEEREIDCLTTYGGNDAVDRGFSVTDLDLWLFSRPQGGAAAGGDLVFLSTCKERSVTRVYLGDVAGHGEQVAPVAERLDALMRRHLSDPDHEQFLESLNEDAQVGILATMVAVSYDAQRSLLVYAYAGHPHLLFRSAKGGKFVSLEPEYCTIPGKLADLVIGAVSGATWFQSGVPFYPGDLAVLYSDGWTEAVRPDGSRPGLDGLLLVVDACPTDSPEVFREALLSRFEEDLGIASFSDDISLVVLRRA